MTDWFDLSGKTALVTGGSRGIGAAIARALDDCGTRIAVNYVADSAGKNLADAQAVAADLTNPLIVQADVSDGQQVGAMMAQVKDQLGGLDILINNAGILRDRTIKKMSAQEWQSVLNVNLSGTFNCIQGAAPLIRAGGSIVNLASVAAIGGFFGQANYAASKAGVIAVTKVAARELARQSITVNAVAPGFVDTEMTRAMPEDVTKQFISQIPAGRMGRPDEIAGVVLFLCTQAARYITGQVIHVNGGFLMP